MKIIKKVKNKNGRRNIYIFGKRILSYKNSQKIPYEKILYDKIYAKRFAGLTLEEKKFLITEDFKDRLGYVPNLSVPKTFSEKIQWLKLYWHDPLIVKCADKIGVREYVEKTIGSEYLLPCYGTWNTPEDIDFTSLPDQFVLKVNWGCGQNIICKDKKALDCEKAKEQLNEWMQIKNNHYYWALEWSYKNIKPAIMAEKYIDAPNDNLFDYKIMCFNGRAENLFVVSERKSSLKVTFFDRNWNKLPFTRKYPNHPCDIKRPKQLEQMLKLAEQLAAPFPFLRVDFYIAEDRLYVGELTFYPGNGMETFEPFEWDRKFGDLLKLPPFPFHNSAEKYISNVAIYHSNTFTYPDKRNFFRPCKKYPEYIFSEISDTENNVYDAVRENFKLLQLDANNYGTTLWNPLKEFIKPGNKILIKPNLVSDYNKSGQGQDCLYTHPSVVAAVIDYALIALQGTGEIIVGDAPLQECDFEKLITESGYKDMIDWYRSKGVKIRLADLRNTKTYVGKDGLHYEQSGLDSEKNKVVQLNEISSFTGLAQQRLKKLRVTSYDPRILQKHHNKKVHEYSVSQCLLEADVVINVPKPKCHRKAGVTIALKNMVGINAHKEFLPHHTLGSKEEGGDDYLYKNDDLNKAERFLDKCNILNADKKYAKAVTALKKYQHYFSSGKNISKEPYWEGSWYGNDTIWRTISDLNKIVFYADKKGNMTNQPQRRYFIVADMIVCGDHEGPLLPYSKPTGIIASGYNPICFDMTIASIMGFDWHLIPSIHNIAAEEDGACELSTGDFPNLMTNVDVWRHKSLDEIAKYYSLLFEPCEGWKRID